MACDSVPSVVLITNDSMQMDAKLSLDTFETVMQLAIEGCKAVAEYIREVSGFYVSLRNSVYSFAPKAKVL